MHLTHAHRYIWREVLDYFQFSVAADCQWEMIRESWRTILNIALLSQSLTGIALDALWVEMDTLEPVVQVINSFASSEGAFLEYVAGVVSPGGADVEGYWNLRKPIEDKAARSRAQEYLRRIRAFRVGEIPDTKETTLWAVLAACLEPNAPLLPNLRALDASMVNVSPLLVISLIPLLSPTLTSITINHQPERSSTCSAEAAMMLFGLLKSRGCNSLEDITYDGDISPDLLLMFTSFNGLRSLWIECEMWAASAEEMDFPSVLMGRLGSLRNLRIDLGAFLHNEEKLPSPIYRCPLQELTLVGDAEEIQCFLLNQMTSSSLRSLTLLVCDTDDLSWKILCERITSSFPGIRSLCVHFLNSLVGPPLLMQDLLPILSKPLVTELQLLITFHQLTEDNLVAMVKAWPNLRTLWITPNTWAPRPLVVFDASVLLPLSQHPYLYNLNLPLNFKSLLTPLSHDRLALKGRLDDLCIYNPQDFPPTLQEKITIAENLLILFPRLITVSYSFDDKAGVADLGALIKAFNRRAAASYFSQI